MTPNPTNKLFQQTLSSYLDFTACIEQFSPHPAPSEDGVLIETDAFYSTAIGTGGDKIENSRP
ncbi:hypothetical protein B1L04_21990 [Microcystis aeruginosa KW]|uniref:Uncharacterized protein n=1 Tax=Microcystis aeruginosa KW TaxID=1960155 RepID=A0A1V4BPY3_MICAE|nr:hypothetical protein B1L04_21990 [Microcystis aeruginosa KW]